MILSMACSGHPDKYTMGTVALTRTETANDLGVLVNTSLKWNEHLNNIISGANQRFWLTVRTLGYDAPSLSPKKPPTLHQLDLT